MSVVQKMKRAGLFLMIAGFILFLVSSYKLFAGIIGAIGALLYFFERYRSKSL